MSENRDSIMRYLDEVEARANSVAGPTYKMEDREAFQFAAKSDIPMLIRAVKAALAQRECPSCGVQIQLEDNILRTMRPGQIE